MRDLDELIQVVAKPIESVSRVVPRWSNVREGFRRQNYYQGLKWRMLYAGTREFHFPDSCISRWTHQTRIAFLREDDLR